MTRWYPVFLLILSLLTIKEPARAQADTTERNRLKTASFQMVKATVEFLATDKETFPDAQTAQCNTCASYDDLKTFIEQNKLLNADKLVDEAEKKAKQTIVQINQPRRALITIQEYLIGKITGRGREHRKSLPTYAAYEDRLESLVDQIDAPVGPSTPPEVTSDSTDTSSEVSSGAETETTTKTTSSSWISMAGVALFFSLISLVAAGLLWLKSRAPQTSARDQILDSQIAKLNDRISKLEAGRAPTTERQPVVEKLNALEQAVRQLEQQKTTDEPVPQPPAPARPAAIVAPPVSFTPPPPVEPAPGAGEAAELPGRVNRFRSQAQAIGKPTSLYGRTADLGDGFSAAGLLTAPDRDTVFDIYLQSDDQAIYRVSENPDAQRIALSDPYSYLNDACEYMTQPSPTSRIRTEHPGRLALQGEKWKIVEKAKISFF